MTKRTRAEYLEWLRVAPRGLDGRVLTLEQRAKGTPGTVRIEPPSVVYLIEAVGQSLVKIGYTDDLRRRFQTLATMSPVRLKLRRVLIGGADVEGSLHQRFGALRAHGEWFNLTGELREYLDGGAA